MLTAALLVGCATVAASIPIQYIYSDAPSRAGIELSYVNRTNRTVCLSPSQWPNSAGKINQANRVSLIVDGQRYPIEVFNTGYCFGGCPTYVEPGQRVRAFVPYRDFKLPPALASKSKQLEFSPSGYVCKHN
jgi:hypothetical protein